jgi:hypothetical protein
VIDGTFEVPHVAVLEIKNVGNFKIRFNFRDPIAMMLFAELKDPVTQKYRPSTVVVKAKQHALIYVQNRL